MVGRDGISHKKLHNKTNTMKHVSVVMTVVTNDMVGRDCISHKKLHNKLLGYAFGRKRW